MKTTSATALLTLSLALAGGTAFAEDENEGSSLDSAAEPAIGFVNFVGLSGFQKMVDGRTPRGMFNIRGGVRYDFTTRTVDITGAGGSADVKFERQELSLYGGATLLGFAEAALSMPYVNQEIDFDFSTSPNTSDNSKGWGDMDLAGKVSLGLGPFDIAVYATGQVPTSEPDINTLRDYEWGIAGTFSILNEHLSIHGNVGGLHEDKGLNGLVYRVGGAFVAYASHTAVLRLYGYADGVEWEGDAGSALKVDFGVQALVLDIITLEVGSSVTVLNADKVANEIEDELELNGVFADRFDDEGAWSITAAVGILF